MLCLSTVLPKSLERMSMPSTSTVRPSVRRTNQLADSASSRAGPSVASFYGQASQQNVAHEDDDYDDDNVSSEEESSASEMESVADVPQRPGWAATQSLQPRIIKFRASEPQYVVIVLIRASSKDNTTACRNLTVFAPS